MLLFGLLLTATFCQAQGGAPADFKRRVEWTLGKRHPEYRKFYCNYFGPARATIGVNQKEVYAVCCIWGGELKSGGVPLMITTQCFAFDGQKLSDADEGEIRWIDPNPIPEKMRLNHSSKTLESSPR